MSEYIDTETLGAVLLGGQNNARLSRREIDTMLRLKPGTWHKYILNTAPIPKDILIRIISAGLSYLSFRYRSCPSVRDVRRREHKALY